MRRLSLALALLIVGSVGFGGSIASAGPVLVQPPVWAGNGSNVGVSWTSQTSSQTGFVAFDDFSFANTTAVNQVTWFGIYLTLNLTNGAPNTTRWDTLIFDSLGPSGTPQTLLGGQIDNTTVTRTTAGTGFFGANPVTVYQFTATFPTFTALPGVHYWFSPVSVSSSSFDPFFSWIQGTGGDSHSFQAHITNLVTDGTFFHEDDRAFALGTVPEPTTLALVGGGLALIRRRRRA